MDSFCLAYPEASVNKFTVHYQPEKFIAFVGKTLTRQGLLADPAGHGMTFQIQAKFPVDRRNSPEGGCASSSM
jgi:hypothetical protein